MSALRRLSNDDVKKIFDCVHNNKVPPQRLAFQIVVVGPNGMRLSPPSFKFEDGLYVFLKPLKKVKGPKQEFPPPEDDPRVPSTLKSVVFKETPKEICPWSLSGPQFPTPTAIQQRYCYPKGDPEYSSMKGGALWTTYKENGSEDLDFRILHVYYSAKRAGNKSIAKSSLETSSSKRNKPTKPMPVTMPKLNTPARQHCNLFDSSFDDSPLSFDISVSPFKDVSLVSLLTNSASVDNESEAVISPDRGFFDVQTAFEKANGIGRSNDCSREQVEWRRENTISNTGPPPHPRYHPSQCYPYWSMYHHPPVCPTYSADSNERQTGSWAYTGPPFTASFPTQQARKSSDTVAEFVNELKATRHRLRERVLNAGEDGDSCEKLLCDWGRYLTENLIVNASAVPFMNKRKEVGIQPESV